MKVQSKIKKNTLKNLQYDCQNRKVEKKLKNLLEIIEQNFKEMEDMRVNCIQIQSSRAYGRRELAYK